MKTLRRSIPLAAFLLFGAALGAQDPWEGGFKVTAATFGGSEDAYLGQSRAFGLALFGTYPFGQSSSVSFEGGYRFMPSTTHMVGATSLDDKTDGYYGSAFYRHRLFFEGFHLQAGLRLSQYLTNRRANFFPGDGSSVLTKYKGNYATGIKPVLGMAYRLDAHYGLELNVAPTEMKNVDGASKSGTMLEIALLVHL